MGASLITVKYVLPIRGGYALIALGVLLMALLGIVIVSGRHVARMDSTEAMTVRRDESGLVVNAQYPSVTFVQIVQLLVRAFPKPHALIPPGIDPKDEPSKFKQLTEQETVEILMKEVGEALNRSLAASTSPQPLQGSVGAEGTATVGPKT